MTWWHSHPDAADLVRQHWKDAELLLFAQRQPCIQVRQAELNRINRVMRALAPSDLCVWAKRRTPLKSWLAAVLVCPGDDLADLAAVVIDLGLDASRFHFYLAKGAKASQLAAWAAAGLPLDAVDEGITDWAALHKRLGLDFNVRIVEDFMEGEGA